MIRNEVKKQIERGWLNRQTTFTLLKHDFNEVDYMVRIGTLTARAEHGSKLYKVDDVLAVARMTAKQALDKLCPVDRRKKPTRRQRKKALKTQKDRDRFYRRWFQVQQHVSNLIASPKANIRIGELKLIYQLLTLAYRVKTFDLVLTNKQLMDATGLDDEALPAARRGAEDHGLLKVDDSETPWLYCLLDPKTRLPFVDKPKDDDIVVSPETSWADLR